VVVVMVMHDGVVVMRHVMPMRGVVARRMMVAVVRVRRNGAGGQGERGRGRKRQGDEFQGCFSQIGRPRFGIRPHAAEPVQRHACGD